jgi:hypothetical protein
VLQKTLGPDAASSQNQKKATQNLHWFNDMFYNPSTAEKVELLQRLKDNRWLSDADINFMLRTLRDACQDPLPQNFTIVPSHFAQQFNATASKKIFSSKEKEPDDVMAMNIKLTQRPWFIRTVHLLKHKTCIPSTTPRCATLVMPVVFEGHWTVVVVNLEVGKEIFIEILDSRAQKKCVEEPRRHAAYYFAQHFAAFMSQQLPICFDPRDVSFPLPSTSKDFETKVCLGPVELSQQQNDSINCGIAAVMAIFERFFLGKGHCQGRGAAGDSFLTPTMSYNQMQKTALANLLNLEQLRNRWVEDLSGEANHFIRLVEDILNSKRPHTYIYFNY